MLSKCANPACATTFRYLHEGRLYVINAREALMQRKRRCSGESGRLEFAWLCSSCDLDLTIQIDEELRAKVVGRLEARNDPTMGNSSSECSHIEIA